MGKKREGISTQRQAILNEKQVEKITRGEKFQSILSRRRGSHKKRVPPKKVEKREKRCSTREGLDEKNNI